MTRDLFRADLETVWTGADWRRDPPVTAAPLQRTSWSGHVGRSIEQIRAGRELVFQACAQPRTASQLRRFTGLTENICYAAIRALEAAGRIQRVYGDLGVRKGAAYVQREKM